MRAKSERQIDECGCDEVHRAQTVARQLGVLLGGLRSPLLEPWGCPDKWGKRRTCEVHPLAFEMVKFFQISCLSVPRRSLVTSLCYVYVFFLQLLLE